MVQRGLAHPKSQLIQGISELVTNDPAAGPGRALGCWGSSRKAAVMIQDGHVAWVGRPRRHRPLTRRSICRLGPCCRGGWAPTLT